MIRTLADISVRKFMAALFNKVYDGIEDWNALYLLYVDTSGFGETKQYELMAAIHNIQIRITTITAFLELQKSFILEFEAPLQYYKNEEGEIVNTFLAIRKFGHRLAWNENQPLLFVQQLRAIDVKERKHVALLDSKMKELNKIKTEGVKEDHNARADFIKMLNALGKANYKIDKDGTDMEELSLMIKQNNEDCKALANQNKS